MFKSLLVLEVVWATSSYYVVFGLFIIVNDKVLIGKIKNYDEEKN